MKQTFLLLTTIVFFACSKEWKGPRYRTSISANVIILKADESPLQNQEVDLCANTSTAFKSTNFEKIIGGSLNSFSFNHCQLVTTDMEGKIRIDMEADFGMPASSFLLGDLNSYIDKVFVLRYRDKNYQPKDASIYMDDSEPALIQAMNYILKMGMENLDGELGFRFTDSYEVPSDYKTENDEDRGYAISGDFIFILNENFEEQIQDTINYTVECEDENSTMTCMRIGPAPFEYYQSDMFNINYYDESILDDVRFTDFYHEMEGKEYNASFSSTVIAN